MLKQNCCQALINIPKFSFFNLLTISLLLLIGFNISWLFILVKISSRLILIKNLGRTIFNLESLLLLGNLSIIVLLAASMWGVKKFSYFKNSCN